MTRLLWLLAAAALAGCTTPPPGPRLTADTRLRVADAAAASGDAALAASLYAAAAASAPQDKAVQLRAAAALARAGRLGDARRVLAARLKADPADPDALRARAALDIGEGHAAEALAALAKAPETPATLADRGVALDLEAQHDAAQALYRKALRGAPDDAAIRNDLALSLLLQGKVQEAIAALAPLAEAASLPARARATLALLYALDGQAERSQELLGRKLPEDYVAHVARAVAATQPPPGS